MCYLDFIQRTCRSFVDLTALKMHYCSFVRSNLESCSTIWTNNILTQNETIECINIIYKQNCLRLIQFKFNILKPIHRLYNDVLSFFNLFLLNDRCSLLLFNFLLNLILGKIDSPELLKIRETQNTFTKYFSVKIILLSVLHFCA